MAAPTLSWHIDTERGTVRFGRTVPFAGNTYDFTLEGGVYGQVYTAYVMDDNGLECLAKSKYENGTYSIAFNTAALRECFLREMHEVRAFHCVIRDAEKTVAEGDLQVNWNPLWTDGETGEPYSMRGPQGKPGEPGRDGGPGRTGYSAYELAVLNGYVGTMEEWLTSLRGQPGNCYLLQELENGEGNGKWHRTFVKQNELGEWILFVDQEWAEYDPDTNDYVLRAGDQTVDGIKTFTESPLVPAILDENEEPILTDNSLKAAPTKWVQALVASKIEELFESDIEWTGEIVHSGDVAFGGTVTFNGPVVFADGTSAQTQGQTDDSTKVATTQFVHTAVDEAFDLFETKWLDYEKPDSGKWRKYKDAGFAQSAFPTAYAHLLNDFQNGATGKDIVSETINATRVGLVIVRDGIASGFDNKDSYLQLPEAFNPNTTPWVMNLKFKTPATMGVARTIIYNQANASGVKINIYSDNKFRLYLGRSSANWNICNNVSGVSVLSANTWYWIRLEFTGTQYILSSSMNGTDYTTEYTATNSYGIYNCAALRIGTDGTNGYAGSQIDLRASGITVGETAFWDGTTRTYIDFIRATDGHKVVASANKAAVDALYAATGIAWYWILDTANAKFYLPRTKWGFFGIRNLPGDAIAAGLPDHNHAMESAGAHNHTYDYGYNYSTKCGTSGSYYPFDMTIIKPTTSAGAHTHTIAPASIANGIYGAADTVQPPGSEMYLYFYLGR